MVFAAVCQMTSTPSIAANLAAATSLIARAAKAGAKLVALPEACDYLAPSDQVFALAEESPAFVSGIAEAAREHNVHVSVGIHEPIPDEERVYNTQLLFDGDGTILDNYRKLHMFDVEVQGGASLVESRTTRPGQRLHPPVKTPVGQIGLLTCYDVRFPEVSLSLRSRHADVLTYPSAFTPKTGEAHWELLLRARAVETQCYVIAAAQTGEHWPGGRRSYGDAMIVDPWGKVVARCGQASDTFALADIDLEYVRQVRRDMPLWTQRRNDVYPEL